MLLSSQINKLVIRLELLTKENPFGNTLGIGRSLIAFSTLTILLFNNIELLFDESLTIMHQSDALINRFNLFAILGYDQLELAKWIAISILVLVISGYLPWFTGILHFWVTFSFHNSAVIVDGGEQIATIFTFLLLPLTLLDHRLNHWQSPVDRSPINKWVGHLLFKVIALQASYIYLNTGVEKLYKVDEWRQGTALYYFFNNSNFGLNQFLSAKIQWFLQSEYVFFLTWWVVLSHLFLAYLLFLKRKSKQKYILVGITFHLGIAIFIGLHSFSIVMFGVLVLYLLPFHYTFKKPNLLKKLFPIRKTERFRFLN